MEKKAITKQKFLRYQYDGTLNGFLSAVFHLYKVDTFVLQLTASQHSSDLFDKAQIIPTNLTVAQRVWKGITKKRNSAGRLVYYALQSEVEGIEILLLRYIQKLMRAQNPYVLDMETKDLVLLHKLEQQVATEKVRIEHHTRFININETTKVAFIQPKADVLPLVSKYFREKNPSNQFLIYDTKRHKALVGLHGKTMEKQLRFSPAEMKLLETPFLLNPAEGNNLEEIIKSNIPSSGIRFLLGLASTTNKEVA